MSAALELEIGDKPLRPRAERDGGSGAVALDAQMIKQPEPEHRSFRAFGAA
jgi:hypothetical protein